MGNIDGGCARVFDVRVTIVLASVKPMGRWLGAIWLSLQCLAVQADPLPAAVESCQQIRQKIGTLPPADAELLRTLAIRGDCRFTAAEVYRAAYGDKPMPVEEPRRHLRYEHDDDD